MLINLKLSTQKAKPSVHSQEISKRGENVKHNFSSYLTKQFYKILLAQLTMSILLDWTSSFKFEPKTLQLYVNFRWFVIS